MKMLHRTSRQTRFRGAIAPVMAKMIEPLERRVLLSLSAAGGEFRANTFTTTDQSAPAVAADPDGDFVIVWQGSGSGDLAGIFAQRYNAAGAAQGGEFRVNSTTALTQQNPTVAMDADGDFVIAWESLVAAGNYDIFYQRYNAAGVAQGGEGRANTFTTSNQTEPSIAIDASGDFAIAWTSIGQEGASNRGIYAQRYSATGQASGGEIHVNTVTTNNQLHPAVAMDVSGDFIVTWFSYGTYGIFAQRYGASGAAIGGQVQLNGIVDRYALAMDADGDFVLTWDVPDGSDQGIFARRFNAAGVAQGTQFPVNTVTAGTQQSMAVAMDADGDFLITWESFGQDGSLYGIYAQAFNAAGAAQGGEFRVNTFTTNRQRSPAVAMDADGDAVIAWQSLYQDTGTSYGVYEQRYNQSNADTAPPMVGGVFVGGSPVQPYTALKAPISQIAVSFSEDMSVDGGTSGANSVTNPANWLYFADGINVITPLTITYGFNAATNRFEAILILPSPLGGANVQIRARDGMCDVAGNHLDGNLDGAGGGSMLTAFSVAPPRRDGSEFRANTFTTNNQSHPVVAMAASTGSFVVVWSGQGATDASGIFAQRYNSSGVAQGGEFRVNTFTTNAQSNPAIAMDSVGDFMVAWSSFNQDGSNNSIYAQRYDFFGQAQGSEFRVNTYTTNTQDLPSVAVDGNGDFIVAWQSYRQDNPTSGYGVYAQRYNAAGTVQGAEFRVNSFTTGNQRDPSVAADGSGNFVVTWSDSAQNPTGVYARRYNAAGVAQGSELYVGVGDGPAVAMDAAGDFVVASEHVYYSYVDHYHYSDVNVQRYNAAGVPQGAPFRLDHEDSETALEPSITMNPAGEFIIASLSFDNSGSGIGGRRFTAAGQGFDAFSANSHTLGDQTLPSVAMDSNGDSVVVWNSYAQDGSLDGVYAQRYRIRSDTPIVMTLTAAPDPLVAGNSLTLSASGVSTVGAVVRRVSFYRESNGEPGLQTGIEGDTFIASDASPSGGVWSVNTPLILLPAGTYSYYAQAFDDAFGSFTVFANGQFFTVYNGLVGAPATTTGTVFAAPGPLVTAAEFNFDTAPQKLKFTFDRDVSASVSLSDISITKVGGGAVAPFTLLPYGTDGANVVSVTFNTPLPDGNFRVTLLGSDPNNGISDPISGNRMASDYVFDFFILGGDANHDRVVDINDLYILATNFNGTGKTFSQADFNYDTLVNAADLGILSAHWQQALSAPPLVAPIGVRVEPRRTPVRVIQLISNSDI